MAITEGYVIPAIELDSLSAAGGVTATIKGVTSSRYSKNVQQVIGHGDSEPRPRTRFTERRSSMIDFTSFDLPAALANIPSVGLDIGNDATRDGLKFFLQKILAGGMRVPIATAQHKKLTMRKGILVPVRLEIPETGNANVACQATAVKDGANAPVAVTSNVALETAGGASVGFGLGPVKINGTTIVGRVSASINFGITVEQIYDSGEIDPTEVHITTIEPSISLVCLDVANFAVLGLDPLDISSTVVIYCRKRSADGYVADITAEHVSLTINDGIFNWTEAGGEDNKPIRITGTIDPSWDGTNAPIVTNTATAIS